MATSWCQRLSVFFYIRAVRSIKGLQDDQGQEKRLASIPKAVTDAKIYPVKLRDVPKGLTRYDAEKMIKKHNFFEKNLNEEGDFANAFVDNADGTITDRATGLMWDKGGSSSTLYIWKAEKYVSRLNKEKFLGYDDWRIPTLEELCSLVERERNERGQHISRFFKGNQSVYWSKDHFTELSIVEQYFIVNFAKGNTGLGARADFSGRFPVNKFSIRAVRSIK